jgi:hypothetical protein
MTDYGGWRTGEAKPERPTGPTELRGHLVLVDFWTLTCINWLRTESYIRAWEGFGACRMLFTRRVKERDYDDRSN